MLLLLSSSRLMLLPGNQTIRVDEGDTEEAKEVAEEDAPTRNKLKKAGRVGQEPRCIGCKVKDGRRKGRDGSVVEDGKDVPFRLGLVVGAASVALLPLNGRRSGNAVGNPGGIDHPVATTAVQ